MEQRVFAPIHNCDGEMITWEGSEYRYSGVAWCIRAPGSRIQTITDWPGLRPHGVSNKVPTTVIYSTGGSRVVSWGFEVTQGTAELDRRRGSRLNETEPFSWFKLLLQPQTLPSEDGEAEGSPELNTIRGLLEKYHKSAYEVSTDYLRKLWGHTKQHLGRRLGGNFLDLYEVLVVLTTPAVWTPGSTKTAERLARDAGFPGTIHLLQEPEAAAIEVLEEPASESLLKLNDIITVCDAGGGTCVSGLPISDKQQLLTYILPRI